MQWWFIPSPASANTSKETLVKLQWFDHYWALGTSLKLYSLHPNYTIVTCSCLYLWSCVNTSSLSDHIIYVIYFRKSDLMLTFKILQFQVAVIQSPLLATGHPHHRIVENEAAFSMATTALHGCRSQSSGAYSIPTSHKKVLQTAPMRRNSPPVGTKFVVYSPGGGKQT